MSSSARSGAPVPAMLAMLALHSATRVVSRTCVGVRLARTRMAEGLDAEVYASGVRGSVKDRRGGRGGGERAGEGARDGGARGLQCAGTHTRTSVSCPPPRAMIA